MVQPYPLPRGTRQTAVLVGDGVSLTYGPFGFSIFDVEDVLVYRAEQGELGYALASVVIAKTDPAAAFSPFTVTFPAVVPTTTQFVVQSRRVHERSSDVTKGIGLDSNALEKEFSKQGQVLQELRRDLNATIRIPFGFLEPIVEAPQDGRALMWELDGLLPRVVNGPTADEIGTAQSYAEDALASEQAAEAAAATAVAAANGILVYQTEAAFLASNVPASVSEVRTLGYSSPGDGGGHIKVRIATPTPVEPWHKQSADGAWWRVEALIARPQMFGARGNSTNGTNGNDDSAAFNAVGNYCRAFSRALYIPRPNPGYRLTQQINLRYIPIAGDAFFWLDTLDIGVIIGGNAQRGTNPDQNIGTVQRRSGLANDNPCVRLIGAKGQRVWIKYTQWLQLWAETLVADDGSMAYSEFHFDWPDKLTIEAPAANGGWINENHIFLKRCSNLLIKGSAAFRHNHNHFYGGTFENTSRLEFIDAADNKLHDIRFEAGPTTIIFSGASERNVIYNTWASSEFGGWPNNPLSSGTITDTTGLAGNIVIDENTLFRKSEIVASADIFDVMVNNRSIADAYTPVRTGSMQAVQGSALALLCVSDYLDAVDGDHFFFHWNAALGGGAPTYRGVIYFFDRTGAPVTADATFIRSFGSFTTVSGNALSQSANRLTGDFLRVASEAIAAGVRFIRVGVLAPSSGGVQEANRLNVIHWALNRTIDPAKPEKSGLRLGSNLPVFVSATPTVLYGPAGTVLLKNDYTGRLHLTSSSRTTVAGNAASGATSITVSDATGFAVGDIIGVNLDGFGTHWTTVASVSGTTIGLTVVLPSSSTGSRPVYRSRLRLEAFTVTTS